MNTKKTALSIIAVLALFVFAARFQGKKIVVSQESSKQPISVSVQSAGASKTLTQEKKYPANVVGDQDVKITAKSAGTIVVAPGNIGEKIGAGSLLAKIDDTGTLDAGAEGLKSLQVQQSEIAAEQAKKSYSLAKDNYKNLKNSSLVTSAQKDSAETQRDIAKLQYENALLGLNGAVDNHLITSPIAGVITNKTVSVGDFVSVGQQIATISKSANIKVQFFVDQDQRSKLTRGQKIFVPDGNGKTTTLIIRNIAIAADQATKRFLIEAYPEKQTLTLLAGTITTVSIQSIEKPEIANNLILPLSAINIGQNESYIFVIDNDVAKKTVVTIAKVNGENAEISSSLSDQTLIVIGGNKLLHDGEIISLQN